MNSSFTHYRKTIYNSSVGNILEWYDFGLFSIFSGLFSHLFFPAQAGHAALLGTFMIFAVGFLCRPLGALLFGYLGDTKGRAKTLRLSILMISIPTLAIGLLPTYQQVGIIAPILLLMIRMCQGISIGGEYSGNLIYLAETAPRNYRATFTSLACTGSNIGILFAAITGIILSRFLSTTFLNHFGWRLPYLFGGILCLTIYLFRLNLTETPVFQQLKQHHQIVDNPITEVFTHHFPQLLRTLGLVCMGSTFYYFCFVYIPIFIAQHNNETILDISTMMSFAIALMIVLIPISGYLCDRIGRRKMLLFNAAFIFTCTIPGFYFLQYHYATLFIPVLLLYAIASSLEQGTTSVAVIENFSSSARYTGVSLGYNLGNGLLGGTVPIVCEWLLSTTSMNLAPAIYIACCALLTGVIVYFFVPETKGSNLLLSKQ